jgi:hypothetical protein
MRSVRVADGKAVQESGVYFVGMLVSSQAGREYKDKAGEVVRPWEIKVLVGDRVQRIDYGSDREAHTVIDGQVPGAPVTVKAIITEGRGKDGSTWLRVKGVPKAS